jgi:DNA-binding transcriptional LysR family regulator
VGDNRIARQWCEVTEVVRGTIKIGTAMSHNVDIPTLLAQFHARHPAVEIMLCTNGSDALIEELRTGRLDTAIVALGPDQQPEGLAIEVVAHEAIGAAVSRTHAWASQTIALKALHDVALIVLPTGTEIRRQLENACRDAGFVPHIAFEASTPAALADLGAQGLGVAVIRESLPRSRHDLHALSINPELRVRLALRGARPVR